MIVARANRIKLTTRRSLAIVGVFAIIFAVPVSLHRRVTQEDIVIHEIESDNAVVIAIAEASTAPKHSGGYHILIYGRFPENVAGSAWRRNVTPKPLRFLPQVIQSYCFASITSVRLDCNLCDSSALDHLHKLSNLKSLEIIGGNPDSDAIERLKARFPGISIVDLSSFWSPLGTRKKNGAEPGV